LECGRGGIAVVDADGHIVWRDLDPKDLGAVLVFHGADMRPVDEAELQKHRWFLESIVEEVPLMIFVKEANELRFERFNRAAEALLGIKRDVMIGKNDYDFFPKEQADFFTARDRETLALGKVVDIPEERILTSTGERWLHTRKVPILDEQGHPKYLLGISEDITERRASAEALRLANEQLEARVRMRTEELESANDSLRHEVTERRKAEEALREANRQKDQFMAVLSHELRNPLAPIRNAVYVLERAAPDSEHAVRVRAVIDRQVGHLTRLVDDLLDVSRIAHGKLRLQRVRLDLNDLAQRAADDLRSLFVSGDVQLEVHRAPTSVWVSADPTRLAQVIGNLLTNAARFTPRGGKATVSIGADAERREATVVVTDTGCGIAPDLMPRLFRPFAQADDSLDRSKGGLGLGLALVKSLTEMHGGRVRVASRDGASFSICLPLDIDAPRPVEAQAAGDTARRRVLVIEDNVDAAETLRDALTLCGHVVEVAYDGPDGVERARSFEPDVVLCDIGLPGMDGYGVARTMRAESDLDRVALVALTGYTRLEDVAKAKEAGFDEHLAKPPTIEALENVIARAARLRRVHGMCR
jgi:PAS domain S-box-containing protein